MRPALARSGRNQLEVWAKISLLAVYAFQRVYPPMKNHPFWNLHSEEAQEIRKHLQLCVGWPIFSPQVPISI